MSGLVTHFGEDRPTCGARSTALSEWPDEVECKRCTRTLVYRHDASFMEIGSRVAILFFTQYGHPELGRVGLIERHPRPDNGALCMGSVTFDHVPVDLRGRRYNADGSDAGPNPVWHVGCVDPLTLSPSLLCRTCGHHGFIREGRWVSA